MLRISTLVLDVSDMKRAMTFWSQALHYEAATITDTWISLKDPQGRGVNLDLQPNHDARPEPANRAHLDLAAQDVEKEAARLVALGARRLAWEYPEGARYVVLADPSGNEFCIVPE